MIQEKKMITWKNDDEMFSLMKEKLYTPVVGDILDQMGYNHQFLPAAIRPLASQVPIVAMTANAFYEDIRKAKEAGMDGHIAKPIDVKKMLEELTRILG